MRVLILANGEPPEGEWVRQIADEHDLLMATDGAAHHAVMLGLSPQIVCGDFDSVAMEEARLALPEAQFLTTPDQDRGDLEKALHLAREQGASLITIVGASGGRVDHTLANFSLLLRYHAEIPLTIREKGSAVRAISPDDATAGRHRILTTPGDTISLLSLDGRATVTLNGVQWPLDGYRLPIGTQGVSNVALKAEVSVEVREGILLLMHLEKAMP